MRFQSTPPARGATPDMQELTAPDMFQSTPPARGATYEGRRARRSEEVSIHAPRAGGDTTFKLPRRTPSGFNPRPPRGGAT